ncbi:unnamed protein product, partial [Closterium sp. NIES-53]
VDYGRLQEALSAFNQLEAVRGFEENALVGRGTVHFLAGNLQQALADLSQATVRFPESTDAWQRRAVVLLKMGRLEEAIAAMSRAVQLHPHDLDLLRQRGKLFFQAKDYRAAVADLSPLQDTPMATVDVLRTLGWASAAMGAFKAATKVYGRAVRLFPQEGALWREKGCSHKELGEVVLARECLEKAVAVERDLENYHKLALLHMHTGKPRQALEVAKEGLQLFPQSTNLHYLAASAHHALANFSAAARHYSTVLALGGRSQEENAQLYHNLAFYQREVAAYTHASLTHPFTEFSMDAYLHSALLEAWMRKEPHQLLPPSVVRYTTQQQLQQQQRQEEKRQQKQQQEVELSEEALAVVEKADELGPRAMYRVGGFLHDPRKVRCGACGGDGWDGMERCGEAHVGCGKREVSGAGPSCLSSFRSPLPLPCLIYSDLSCSHVFPPAPSFSPLQLRMASSDGCDAVACRCEALSHPPSQLSHLPSPLSPHQLRMVGLAALDVMQWV